MERRRDPGSDAVEHREKAEHHQRGGETARHPQANEVIRPGADRESKEHADESSERDVTRDPDEKQREQIAARQRRRAEHVASLPPRRGIGRQRDEGRIADGHGATVL